jgi:hypothetical protein
MKQISILLLLTLTAFQCYSINDKIRLGLQVSPGVSWSKPFDKDLLMGKPRFAASYGFVLEYWFAKNYGLTAGVNGAYDGFNVHGRARFENDLAGNKIRTVNEKYAFHYLEIPAYLKLKTNDIKGGKFSVWGQVGFTANFTVSARASYSDSIPVAGGNISIERENILKRNNDVALSIPGFWANFFDIRLGAGGGFEYRFDKRSSLVAGLFYHNGFINNLFDHDAKKEPNVMRTISLRIGILF